MAEREISTAALERALARVRSDVTTRVSPPPLAAAIKRAGAARRRRRGLAVVVVAAVAVAVLALWPSSEPRTLAPVHPVPTAAFLTGRDANASQVSAGGTRPWVPASAPPARLSPPDTCEIPLPGATRQTLVTTGKHRAALVSAIAVLPDEQAAADAQRRALAGLDACVSAHDRQQVIFAEPVKLNIVDGSATVAGLAGQPVRLAVFTEYAVVARSAHAVAVVSLREYDQSVSDEQHAQALARRVLDRLANAD